MVAIRFGLVWFGLFNHSVTHVTLDTSITCYNKNYQQMQLFCIMSLFPFFSSFPYMFRAFMGPSSGVFQAVVFMLPLGSCSALLIVCVRQRTGLWW